MVTSSCNSQCIFFPLSCLTYIHNHHHPFTKQITCKIVESYFFALLLLVCKEKRSREVPGPSKKIPGLFDFFSPGTTGPRDLQGL